MQIFLTLPAYNEEQALPQVLSGFEKAVFGPEFQKCVVVVDDGSTDGTLAVINEWSSRLSIDVVRHPCNRGLGETIEDGLRRAAELAAPGDIIVTMDGDNTHSPAQIRKMIGPLGQGCDVVIASRYQPGSRVVGLSGFRHLMSYGARILFQLVFPIPGVKDYTCGFRAYRAAIVQQAFERYGGKLVTETGFAAMAEILLRLRAMGGKMSEVPMVLRYDQKLGAGKMRVAHTVLKTLALMARYRFNS
jgi:dolichol-phosphate mannosyltransferase